jgi:hypothetical protein
MCKSTRRGAKFILNILNIEAHVRNDVKQSVGLVVTSDWVGQGGRGSIRLPVVCLCVNLCYYKPSFGDTEKVSFLFKLTSAFCQWKKQ